MKTVELSWYKNRVTVALHHLCLMWAKEPDPLGMGDTRSWFTHYKWYAGGEVWVPQPKPYFSAVPGDYLWFAFDLVLFGGAKILRVELDESQGRQELWFNSDETITFSAFPPQHVHPWVGERRVPAEFAEQWLQAASSVG